MSDSSKFPARPEKPRAGLQRSPARHRQAEPVKTSRRTALQLLAGGATGAVLWWQSDAWWPARKKLDPQILLQHPTGIVPPVKQAESPAKVTPAAAQTLTAERFEAAVAQAQTQTPTSFGLDLPGILQRQGDTYAYLTLDLCGGPGGEQLDTELVDFLVAQQIPATFFVNLRWIEANPQLFADLAANPLFLIANHGSKHAPVTVRAQDAYGIMGTASAQEAAEEVTRNHRRIFELTGVEPKFFRSGTAHYDDVGVSLVQALGEVPVGFSINADGGATFSAQQVAQQLLLTAPGDIIIAHANRPGSGTAAGMRQGLVEARSRGVQFATLTQV
ncbi:MAG: polysaccharide deacetylase family protein [Actinomycetaceae bacterium]|nr:polysaccharide deacetylase family protein [Actinomycetaceae bacterium]